MQRKKKKNLRNSRKKRGETQWNDLISSRESFIPANNWIPEQNFRASWIKNPPLSNIVFYVGRVHILEAFTPQEGEGGWRWEDSKRKGEKSEETMRPRRALAPFRVQECCLGYFRLPSFAPLFVAATSNEITKEGRHVGPRDSHFSSIYDLIAGFFQRVWSFVSNFVCFRSSRKLNIPCFVNISRSFWIPRLWKGILDILIGTIY